MVVQAIKGNRRHQACTERSNPDYRNLLIKPTTRMLNPLSFSDIMLIISRGRILSTEFMELPSKKEWPLYYKEIKRPQCLENIFVSLL
jgi:hypothetical protein